MPTLFVFYAQSSKIGEGSYCLGMGKVWGSNSNLGSYPFLENVFLASWATKCLEMPSQAIYSPMRFLLHVVGDSWGILPHVFVVSFIFPMVWNFIWEMLSGWDPPWMVFTVVFLIVIAGKLYFCFVQ